MRSARFAKNQIGACYRFFLPSAIVRDYIVVVEGASDVAAMMTTGFRSVVGRPSCTGSVQHLVSLCRRMNPRRVIIVPDNDIPGIRGTESLAAALPCDPKILRLPKGVKDVRACISETKNADWLRDQIGKHIQLSTNGETIHDRSF
jgi:DNA primase